MVDGPDERLHGLVTDRFRKARVPALRSLLAIFALHGLPGTMLPGVYIENIALPFS